MREKEFKRPISKETNEEEVSKESINELLTERLDILSRLKVIDSEVRKRGYGADINKDEIRSLEERIKEIESEPEVLVQLYQQAKQEDELWKERGKGYAILNLDEVKDTDKRWGIAAFLDFRSPYHSDKIEIGFQMLKPGLDLRKHLHEEMEETFIVLNGEMNIEVKGQIIKVGERELILVRSNFPHKIVDFTPGTEVLLLKTPSRPKDKKIIQKIK